MAIGMNLSMSHAVVMVKDMDKMIDFYTRVLGFEVTDRGPLPRPGSEDKEIVFLGQSSTEHHQMAFVSVREDEGRSNTVDHLAFRAGSLDDVRRIDAELETEGIKRRPVTHGNAWSVYFADPEMNGIEIFVDTPFHAQQPLALPMDLSLDDEALLQWTKEQIADNPEFGPIDEFYASRREHLANRR